MPEAKLASMTSLCIIRDMLNGFIRLAIPIPTRPTPKIPSVLPRHHMGFHGPDYPALMAATPK